MNKNKRIKGQLDIAVDGYGFVSSGEEGVPDVFIPAHMMGDALNKDTVEIEVSSGRGGKMEGRVVGIVERGMKRLVGRFELRGKGAFIVTDDLRVKRGVVIPRGAEGGARHGEMVTVEITAYPRGDKPIEGKVIARLGQRGCDQTEINVLMARHNLPGEFDPKVVKEAKEAADRFKDLSEKRIDLTNVPLITIDGEDAKDFDDAVAGERQSDGSVKVWVSIADVSNFVRPGTILDNEATARGNSIYFPGFSIPMLPEDLSSNICSLIAGEPRYTFTAEMIIDPSGHIKKPRFYKSTIKSRYRMTYTEAHKYISGHLLKEGGIDADVVKSIGALKIAAGYLRQMRKKRGSIDFDLPEPEIVVDMRGNPENIVKAERNEAHTLIEDLMIAANEAVATFLTRRGYPCVFRVHDRPDNDKLLELRMLLGYLGHNIKIVRDPVPSVLAKVVGTVAGRPEERLINMLLLRSMSQAIYSTENIGHYGLASSCYAHFTSPIRRYPDLLVHRLLADTIGAEKFQRVKNRHYLVEAAQKSSKTERRAMEAEREAHDLYSAIFMRTKIGEEFDGIISHTAKKGVFVELIEYFVEGLIKPEDLPGKKFKYDKKNFSYSEERTGKSMKIGDKIRVVLKDVSTEDRRIYFEPV